MNLKVRRLLYRAQNATSLFEARGLCSSIKTKNFLDKLRFEQVGQMLNNDSDTSIGAEFRATFMNRTH